MQLDDSVIKTREVTTWNGLHLFHFDQSSCSQKVRILLRELGIGPDRSRNRKSGVCRLPGSQAPAGRFPGKVGHGCVEPDNGGDVEVVSHGFHVSLNLRPVRVAVGPVRLQRKRKRVPRGRNVTGKTWIGVFAPGTTKHDQLFRTP